MCIDFNGIWPPTAESVKFDEDTLIFFAEASTELRASHYDGEVIDRLYPQVSRIGELLGALTMAANPQESTNIAKSLMEAITSPTIAHWFDTRYYFGQNSVAKLLPVQR